MEFFNEYGLLIAVAAPATVIVLINVVLAFGGEKGTLLFPTLGGYPKVLAEDEQASVAMAEEPSIPPAPARQPRPAVTAGYDEADELLARQAA